MLCGFLPFEDPDTALLYKQIMKGDFEIPDFLSTSSIDLLKGILCTNPDKRLTIQKIRSHPWVLSKSARPSRSRASERTSSSKP